MERFASIERFVCLVFNPQAFMSENTDGSIEQFSDNPCMVLNLDNCSPIAPIFFSSLSMQQLEGVGKLD